MQSKKNILIYFPSIENGGMEKNLFNLFNYLSKKKEFNLFLACNHINFRFKKNISDKIHLIQYKPKKKLFLNRYLISIYSFFFFIKKLKSSFLPNNTIIFSVQNSIISVILSKILGFKIIIRNGNHPWSALKYSDNLIFSLISFFIRFFIYNFADKIVCNSEESKKFFSNFILKKSKLFTIKNSIILKQKNSSKKKNFILSAGRLTKQKDFVTLLKAFKIFKEKNRNYKLLILGEGKEKKSLTELAKSLNIHKSVKFKGFVKKPLPFFSNAKMYICSSLYEGLPSTLIEALSVGTPIISTNCQSGPSEILCNGKFGYLFDVRDHNALAHLMNHVVKNYQDAIKKILKGRKTLYQYQVKNVSVKYINEINKLL